MKIVRTDAEVKFAGIMNWFGPLLKFAMRKDFNNLAGELQYRIENGEAHPDVQRVKAQQLSPKGA